MSSRIFGPPKCRCGHPTGHPNCCSQKRPCFGLRDTTGTSPLRRRRSQSSIPDAVEGCRGLPCRMPPTGPEGPGRQSRHGRRQGGCQIGRTGRQSRWNDLAGSRTVVVAGDQRPSSMSSADAPRSVRVISTVPVDRLEMGRF